MLGQTRLEFMFGVVIFSVLVFYIVSQMNGAFSSIITDYDNDAMKTRATSMIKYLVEMGDLEKQYLTSVPVDVMLVSDISGSMDGSTASLGENCRLRCDTFGSGTCLCTNGCPSQCSDCNRDGYYADPGETPCSINDAKSASKIFLSQLDAENDTAGLVVFNGSTYLYQSLTSSFNLVETAIDRMNGDGSTAIGEGIVRAKDEFVSHGRVEAKWIEVLLTDGKSNSGISVESGTQEAKDSGIKIFAIGLGESDYFDEDTLKYVASETGGKYYNAPSSTDLVQIYNEIAYEIKTERLAVGVLVNKPYLITEEKLNELRGNCNKLDIFDLGEYRLKIYNSTSLALSCGTESLNPPRVFVTKYVNVNDEIGNITVEVW